LGGQGQKSRTGNLQVVWCAFTCVGWQVTLRDPIWQVTSRSSEMDISSSALFRL